MHQIQQLPPSVVNKIAAGEVIERPSSVVKELLENAVDAGATRVDVTVARGGTELVRVADNGCGIPAEQVPLAVASHATSKIRTADDLFRVQTLGFRGEALASIAAVSRLVLRTRTADADAGVELTVDAGQAGEPAPCGCPQGTIVEVHELFYNTPVRRKFLRTAQTEMGHVIEALARVALAHPAIHFTLRHNQRVIHELPAVQTWRERIVALFPDLDPALIPVAGSHGDARLSGFVADPSFSRSNNRMQYFFLNGRHVRDRSLQHALGEAYRGLLLTGRYPIAFLQLRLPPDAVDVNVHPAKLEVRLQDNGQLYSLLLSTLRSKFLTTDLTATVQPPQLPAEHPAAAMDRRRVEQQQQLSGWIQPPAHDVAVPPPAAATDSRTLPARPAPLEPARPAGVPSLGPRPQHEPAGPAGPPRRHADALQIHNRYLVAEDERGVVIIDQHALHERILYEQLREKVVGGRMETQRLLVPEPVELTSAEAAAVMEAKGLLAQLGIEVEAFGGRSILVSAYPAMLANLSPGELLRQVVEQLMAGGKPPDRRDLLDELLHMIACKAAVKAGDRLTPDEISALLEHRQLCQDAHHCPHGRPTALVFTRQELDRRFKRT